MPWRSATGDEPPVGEDFMTLSDNVEVLMDDDSIKEGFYDCFKHEWLICVDDKFVVTDSAIAWRELNE